MESNKLKTYLDIAVYNFDNKDYNYQPFLTDKLTNKPLDKINQNWINEVVLWKLNRYVKLEEETIELLNSPAMLAGSFDESFTRIILKKLLTTHGIRLAMASTLLRFRNPAFYQILDQRAYRFVYGHSLNLKTGVTDGAFNQQIDLYIGYLQKLHEISIEKNWRFEELDQILYLLDIKYNDEEKIKY